MRRLRDERGLVGRAAITLLILIVLGGLAAVDGTSVLLAKLQSSNVADAAANAAAGDYSNSHSLKEARYAADEAAKEQDVNAKIVGFKVSANGFVTVTVVKRASTLIVQRVGFLRHLGIVHDTSTAGP